MLVVTGPRGEKTTGGANASERHFLIVDRQNLFLAALRRLLTGPPLNSRVTLATRSDVALEVLASKPIDVVFCELRAEPLSGTALAGEMVAREITSRLVLLADAEDERLQADAFGCGAVGFFSKSTSYEELLEGVQAILAGHYVVSGQLMDTAFNGVRRPADRLSDSRARRLSPAEVDILTLVGQAKTIAAIAIERGISQKTVRNHLASIYRKLELNGRTEAILCAARMGLTDMASLPIEIIGQSRRAAPSRENEDGITTRPRSERKGGSAEGPA